MERLIETADWDGIGIHLLQDELQPKIEQQIQHDQQLIQRDVRSIMQGYPIDGSFVLLAKKKERWMYLLALMCTWMSARKDEEWRKQHIPNDKAWKRIKELLRKYLGGGVHDHRLVVRSMTVPQITSLWLDYYIINVL